MVTTLTVLLATLGGAARTQPRPVDGCWRADPALGYSAGGVQESDADSRRVLVLHPGGAVTRPLLGRPTVRAAHGEDVRWAERSGWARDGDTLHVRVFDGLVGWRLALTRVGAGYAGTATYLTDVVVRGQPPHRIAVRMTRMRCPVGVNARQRLRAGWHPDRAPVYFASQVDRAAALLRESPRPAAAGATGEVLVQYVVDRRGRVDENAVKTLRSDGEVLSAAVLRVLPRLRYRPAERDGQPVAQLVQETFVFGR
jgi:hypothetical protein